MSEFPEKEEHYLLRVQDTDAANKIRQLLEQSGTPTLPPLEIRFDSMLFSINFNEFFSLGTHPNFWKQLRIRRDGSHLPSFSDKEGADPQARTGSLIIEGASYPAKRLDLPSIVETFKTYDECNLVKSGDIGQVRRVTLASSRHLSSK